MPWAQGDRVEAGCLSREEVAAFSLAPVTVLRGRSYKDGPAPDPGHTDRLGPLVWCLYPPPKKRGGQPAMGGGLHTSPSSGHTFMSPGHLGLLSLPLASALCGLLLLSWGLSL